MSSRWWGRLHKIILYACCHLVSKILFSFAVLFKVWGYVFTDQTVIMRVVVLTLLGLIVHVTSAWPLPDVAHATMRLSASRGGSVPLARTKRFITTSLSDRRGKRLIYPDSRDAIHGSSSRAQQVKGGLDERDPGGSAEAMINTLLRDHTRGPVNLEGYEVPAKAVSQGGSVDAMVINLMGGHTRGSVNPEDHGAHVKNDPLEASVEAIISNLMGDHTRGSVNLGDDEVPAKTIPQGGSDASVEALASAIVREQGDGGDTPVKRFIGLEPGHSTNIEAHPQDAEPHLDQPQSAAGLVSRLMSDRRDAAIHQPKHVVALQGVAGTPSSSGHSDDHAKEALDLSTLESLLEKLLAIKLAKSEANPNF